MSSVRPFLWFDDRAEEAANQYVSIFASRPGGNDGPTAVGTVSRYGGAGPRPAGMVMTVEFELDGQPFTALNGGPEYRFTEAISFFVSCRSQQEVDHFWTRLSEGGQEGPCGWLKDRYGLSWQIVPTRLMELMADPDPERVARATQAMLQMRKIDVAELERAAAMD